MPSTPAARRQAKFPDYSCGNTEILTYRACTAERREREQIKRPPAEPERRARRHMMDAQTPKAKTQPTPLEAPRVTQQQRETSKPARSPTRVPAIIVGVVIAVIAGLSIWYLVRPVPLIVQGE